MDEINRYLDNYLIDLKSEGFNHKVITAGRSPYKVLIVFDSKRKNLILFKRVSSIDSIPRNMFKSPGEDISEYILDYAEVNRRLSSQLEFEYDEEKENIVATFNHSQLEDGFEYSTLVLVTFVTDQQDNLVDVSIGIPEYNMGSWIKQYKWSQFIEPKFDETGSTPPTGSEETFDSNDSKYQDLLKRKKQKKSSKN